MSNYVFNGKDNLDDDTMELLELTQDGDDIFDMGTLKTN